ncbi:MAG: aspartate 1-decarboxylase [Chloroflexi bacterium]|nr:aspartate 1-decarboxylase [Chloroflexota bacterium]
MMRNLLLSKIHRATVTGSDLNYIGSITIDQDLMNAAGMLAWEKVQVVDLNNGARLETYVIPGEAGKGDIQLNGAAARLVSKGDIVIIMSYGWLTGDETQAHTPKVVLVDAQNQIEEVRVLPSHPGPESIA